MKHPKRIISTSAFIENEDGQVLLVKTHIRQDTFELPGGQVEEGEALDQAAIREVLEETGVHKRCHPGATRRNRRSLFRRTNRANS